jgi:ABC-type bacteriocin/lantibiotic exporter with double-glycine peptidase domain
MAHAYLWQLIRLERRDLWAIFAFSIGVGLMALATPVAVQTLVNLVAFGMLLQPLVVLVLVLLGCLAFLNLLIGFQIYVVEMLQRRLFVRLSGAIASRLQRVAGDAFDGGNGPELVNRFFDVITVQKSGAGLLMDGLAYALQALIGMLLLAFYHPLLLAFDVLLLLAVMFIFLVLGRRGVATAIAESRAKYAVAAWLETLARNSKLFKWAGSLNYAVSVTDRLTRNYLAAAGEHFTIVMRQQVGLLFLHTLANSSLLAMGGWMVIERQLTLGQLIAAELVVNAMMAGLSRLGKSLISYYELMAGMDKLGHLLNLPLERDAGAVLHPSGGPAAVTLYQLTYRAAGHQPATQEFNAVVAPGQRIAVAGVSGSGQSALLETIFGLRAPLSGAILIDGYDLRDLQLGQLRQNLALVIDVELIEDTVLENLRMGREHISLTAIHDTLAALGLAEAIMALPEGLNTPLNHQGQPLAHEQIRRLLLARAAVGQPRLLLIHELLDALDAEAGPPAIRWLLRSGAPWTAIVVTQHPEVLRHCDRVWHLEKGTLLNAALAPVPALANN